MQPAIETDRLSLRQVKREDALLAKNYLADPVMAELNPVLKSFTVEGFRDWSDELPSFFEKKICFSYAIELNRTFIGICEARFFNNPQIGDLGYWIGKTYWGHGYCTEALNALISYLDSNHSIKEFQAKVLSKNKGSISVLRKIGFSSAVNPESESDIVFTLKLD